MIVDFLAAGDKTPLTKTISSNFGVLTKSAYPNVRNFVSFREEVSSVVELYAAMSAHAEANHCLVKGRLSRQLSNESRQGATNSNETTDWLVFDIDHLPGIEAAEDFVQLLPPEFRNTSYVLQYSASYGFNDSAELRAHIFFMLSAGVMAPAAKMWMKHLNLTQAAFSQHLRLAEGGCTLKWPVDISVNQNDKLIYIAPPICVGIDDPIGKDKRITLVQKTNEKVALQLHSVNAEAVRTAELKVINEMREAAGLEKKKFKTTVVDGVQVINNADQMMLLAPPFEERGFVYLPVSSNRHSYYHPVGNHEFLYTFKDPEIAFPMRVVLPSYYWQQERLAAPQDGAETLIAFRDKRSDAKYIGGYNKEMNTAWFSGIRAREDIDDFFTQHKLRTPELIETWDFEFDPTSLTRVNADKRWANKFVPTTYMLLDPTQNGSVPRRIELLLKHIMNYDEECYEQFLHWLAFKFQTRNKCKTAWFFQGVEGTGKGVLFNKILAPLLGSEQCHLKRMDNLLDRFNADLETSLLWVIDEANIENFKEDGQILEKLKNLIVEDQQVIRAMRTNQYSAVNFTDIILFSNQTLAIRVSPTDRRYNICPRQNTPLLSVMSRDEIATLETDLPQFASFLLGFEVDTRRVFEPLDNEAKRTLISLGRNTHDEFVFSLMQGDLVYFVRAVSEVPDISRIAHHSTVKEIVLGWASNATNNQMMSVNVEDVSKLYTYLMGNKAQNTPTNKMARMLSLRGCVVRHDEHNLQQPFVEVRWTYNELAVERWLQSNQRNQSNQRATANVQQGSSPAN